MGIDSHRVNVIDGGLQSQEIKFRLLEMESNQRDGFQIGYTRNRENVLNPFTIYSEPSRSVAIGPGDYEFSTFDATVSTGSQREFSGEVTYKVGDFYDGDQQEINTSFTWNQSRNFAMSVNYDWTDVELPQGSFIARLTSLNTQVAFTPNLYWISLLQYDNLSENMGINTRIQWIPEAGQEGFIVLNYNIQDEDKDNTFHSAFSDFSIKFNYTFRY